MSFLNRVNSETIAQLFLASLNIICKDRIQYNTFLLVISYVASYMKKHSETFLSYFLRCSMSTVSLIIFMESVKQLKITPIKDQFINNLKGCFKKSHLREGIFKDTVPNPPLPLSPIITGWAHGLTYVFIPINTTKNLSWPLIILITTTPYVRIITSVS